MLKLKHFKNLQGKIIITLKKISKYRKLFHTFNFFSNKLYVFLNHLISGEKL